MLQTFTKLIAASVILVNSQIAFAKNGPNYPEGFTPKTTIGVIFTENKGQVYDQNYKPRPDVLFGALTGNMAFHLKTNGVSYQLYRVDKYKEVEDKKTKEKRKEIDQQTIYRIDLNWVNANKNFTTTTDQTLEGCNNYYLESCPNGALNVKSYTGVTLHNLYKGINLHYYEKLGQLKHDYIVAPNIDYKQIQLKVEGASVSINKDGSLLLTTPLGKIQEGAPIVYQNGKTLKSKWKVNNNTLSFEIENYNANLKLIIDPVTRLWGTYYGATGNDIGYSCATDATGNVYLAGNTTSNAGTVIATAGAHQTVHGGNNDAFLVKFDANGVRQWATFYGGTVNDNAFSCATDATGNVYIAGQTQSGSSGTVIVTAGAHQTLYGGGSQDAFLVKFNSSGIRQWGTYYGGSGQDIGNFCATDATGNVYMAGRTDSNTGTVIATAGAHQVVFAGGIDAFIVQFNSIGIRQWGTYYGDIGTELGNSCATDASGNVYLAGQTTSNTGTAIATAGAHQIANGGGLGSDAFIAKFNSSGIRQWGTYYGDTGNDFGYSCATDATGNVYLAGIAQSSTGTVIATAGAHQTVHGGNYDAILVKFNSSGIRQWGTYYGDTGDEYGAACVTDATGNLYMAGYGNPSTGTIIATTGAHQTVYGGGIWEAFLVKLNSSGVRQWGTYYGGTGVDQGISCATDATGNLYLVGCTSSNTSTVIATAGAHQVVFGGGIDAFLVKLSDCVSLSPIPTSATLCLGTTINLSVSITGTATPTYSWSGPNTYTSNVQNPSINNAMVVNTGIYTVTINNGSCVETTTTQVTVNPLPIIAVNIGSICSGSSFTMVPSGASTYTYSSGSAVVSPTVNSSYNVTGTSAQGCVSSNTAVSSVTVNALPVITAASSSTNYICVGQSATLTAGGAVTYTWSTSSTSTVISVSPTVTTSYTVTGTDGNGCSNVTMVSQSVSACTSLNQIVNSSNQLIVFPNPFNNKITIVSNGAKQSVQVYNALGSVVYNTAIENEKIEIDLTQQVNGIYFVRVGTVTKKLIKE